VGSAWRVSSGEKDFCQTRFSVAPGVDADTFPRLATMSNQSRRIIFLAAFKQLEDYQRPGRKSLAVIVAIVVGFGG
jgi:hypothetical protein